MLILSIIFCINTKTIKQNLYVLYVMYLSEFSSDCEGPYPVKYSASTVNGAGIAVRLVISKCRLIDLPMITGSCSVKSSVIGW